MATGRPYRSPVIHIPPPLFFVAVFAIGWALHEWIAFRLYPEHLTEIAQRIGYGLIGVGTVYGLWGVLTFAHAGTGVFPGQEVKEFVTKGPYRFSRNPMYTGLAVIYLGGMALVNSMWLVWTFPIAVFGLQKLVIKKEEEFLQEKYGADYDAYRNTTRRWI